MQAMRWLEAFLGRREPVGLRIMETDLVFFRDKEDEVRSVRYQYPSRIEDRLR